VSRGGMRPGAGRPRKGETRPVVRINAKVTPEVYAALLLAGGGNLTLGITRLAVPLACSPTSDN